MRALILIVITFQVLALSNGHCTPVVDSKRYIENDFTAPYPKKVVFSCEYRCSLDNQITSIRGESIITVTDISSDARDVVCEGVKVKKTSWGHDFDGVSSFYAYNTRVKEIKDWAFANLELYSPESKKLLSKFKIQIEKVSASYAVAGNSNSAYAIYFKEASIELAKIALELPHNTHSLDFYRQKIIDLNAELGPMATDQLVMAQILYGASWSLPIF